MACCVGAAPRGDALSLCLFVHTRHVPNGDLVAFRSAVLAAEPTMRADYTTDSGGPADAVTATQVCLSGAQTDDALRSIAMRAIDDLKGAKQ